PRSDGPAPLISGEVSAPTEPTRVKVRPGDTLSGIAHDHHVPMRIIAEANHLIPPYRLEAGSTLIIPWAGQPAAAPPSQSLAALPPPTPAAAASPRIEATALDRLPSAPAEKPPAGAAAPPAAPVPATEPARPDPKPAAEPPALNTAAPEPPATTSPLHSPGTFQWPVRGHVVTGYGSGRDGTHNDGINIAAPRGAAVEA